MKSKDDYLSHISRINKDSKDKVQKEKTSRRFTSQQVLNLYRFMLNAVNSGLVIYEFRSKWFISDYTSIGNPVDPVLVDILLRSVSSKELENLKLIRDYTPYMQEVILENYDEKVFLDRKIIKWLAIRLLTLLKKFSITSLIPTSLEAEKLLYLVYPLLDFKIIDKPEEGSSYFSIYDYSNKSIKITNVPAIDVQDLFLFSLKNTKYSIL